jgi:hypothetical protein
MVSKEVRWLKSICVILRQRSTIMFVWLILKIGNVLVIRRKKGTYCQAIKVLLLPIIIYNLSHLCEIGYLHAQLNLDTVT